MHTITLTTGVLSLAISFYLLLSLAYPFISPFQESLYGGLALLAGGAVFGVFGSYTCWNSILIGEEKKASRKLHRKRRFIFKVAALKREKEEAKKGLGEKERKTKGGEKRLIVLKG